MDSDGPSLTNDGSQVMHSDSVVQTEQTHGGYVERTNSESSDEPDNDSIGGRSFSPPKALNMSQHMYRQ